MKKIENYWVDKNGNKWNIFLYSRKEAKKNSATLIHCYNCKECANCSNLHYCENCDHCENCFWCNNCDRCKNCFWCNNCDYCNSSCYSNNCTFCEEYSHCENCDESPYYYIIIRTKTNNIKMIFYSNNSKINVVCENFKGDIKQFEDEIKNLYSEENNKNRIECLKEIEKVKNFFKI